jgi:hypothetical protein
MNLIEVMLASAIFAGAAGGSLQLWAASAAASQQSVERERLLERMDLDLLQLQARWRRDAQGWAGLSCEAATARLESLAATAPVPPQLQRRVEPAPEGTGLVVSLASPLDGLRRQRLFTAAALGPCSQAEVAP